MKCAVLVVMSDTPWMPRLRVTFTPRIAPDPAGLPEPFPLPPFFLFCERLGCRPSPALSAVMGSLPDRPGLEPPARQLTQPLCVLAQDPEDLVRQGTAHVRTLDRLAQWQLLVDREPDLRWQHPTGAGARHALEPRGQPGCARLASGG